MKQILALLTLWFCTIAAYAQPGSDFYRPDTIILGYTPHAPQFKWPELDNMHARFEFSIDSAWLANTQSVFQLEYSCNGVIQTVPVSAANHTFSVMVAPGKYTFQFLLSTDYFELITDSLSIGGGTEIEVDLYFRYNYHSEERIHVLKPVIYTYSPQPQETTIQLRPAGQFTFTYPAYTDSWHGTAFPDGSFRIGDQQYPYLFWEGTDNRVMQLANYSSGFVVKGSEAITFLETQLEAMGFNTKEKTDFITFWGPQIAANGSSFVQFLFNEDYNQIAQLEVQPKPASVYRIYMLLTPLPESHNLHPVAPVIPSIRREGFYLLEWGGSRLSYPLL